MDTDSRHGYKRCIGAKLEPEIAQLIRLAVYRDGGSLSLSYLDFSNKKFRLFFKVDLKESYSSTQIKLYKEPSLDSFIERNYTSPVTRDTMPLPSKVSSETISWEAAQALLERANGLIEKFESEYKWVYQAMVDIARGSGKKC